MALETLRVGTAKVTSFWSLYQAPVHRKEILPVWKAPAQQPEERETDPLWVCRVWATG